MKTAAFSAGAGASDGGEEIDEGEVAGAGEVMTTGEGAVTGVIFDGDGAATGRVLEEDGGTDEWAGAGAGVWAIEETKRSEIRRKEIGVAVERAIEVAEKTNFGEKFK